MKSTKTGTKGLLQERRDLDAELETWQNIARRLAEIERQLARLKQAGGRLYGRDSDAHRFS